MAGDDHRSRPKTAAEDELLRKLRVIAGGVFLVCIVFLVVIDPLGRLFLDPNFRTSDLALGTLIGALLLIIGIETASRLPGILTSRGDSK